MGHGIHRTDVTSLVHWWAEKRVRVGQTGFRERPVEERRRVAEGPGESRRALHGLRGRKGRKY